ncbi:hypothetical protein [Pectobacterium polaris]|uniref:hypothetical protein n=1 Tax=Pectobacterium polaris TaxID=2042057 RepID=UPI001969811D|nr:hypothetical protein [Pectobacterium polaris]
MMKGFLFICSMLFSMSSYAQCWIVNGDFKGYTASHGSKYQFIENSRASKGNVYIDITEDKVKIKQDNSSAFDMTIAYEVIAKNAFVGNSTALGMTTLEQWLITKDNKLLLTETLEYHDTPEMNTVTVWVADVTGKC